MPCAVFSYVRTDRTVTKVSKSEYDACSGSDALSEDNTSGLTTVTLATPGMHYFICIMPDHCAGGMKLAVNVSGDGLSWQRRPGSNRYQRWWRLAGSSDGSRRRRRRNGGSNRAWAAVTEHSRVRRVAGGSACQGTD